MKLGRLPLYIGGVIAVLAVALLVSAPPGGRSSQVASSPSSTAATSTPAPATTAPARPSPAAQAGVITGRISYPSDFIPPVTVYAIGADDQRIWFSVEFPGYGNPPRPTAQPGSEPGTYRLTGVAPGTYWVVAYRNDGQKPDPGFYSRASECLRRTPGGPCPDQSFAIVAVTAGQTTPNVDIVTWWPGSGLVPPPPPRPTSR